VAIFSEHSVVSGLVLVNYCSVMCVGKKRPRGVRLERYLDGKGNDQ